MLEVTNPPPDEVLADLLRLGLALGDDENEGVPAKALDRNLLIATWNLRAFGDLTEKWEAAKEDSPKRDLHSLQCIAEIVSRFDVVAIQEAKDDLKALRHLLKMLGSNWGLSLTDVTRVPPATQSAWRSSSTPEGFSSQGSPARSWFPRSSWGPSSRALCSGSSPAHLML
jgi:hypothetical protein